MATVIENFDVINKNEHKEIGVKHNNNEKWKNYADRICKNPYVKHYLIEKYGRKCAYCSRPIMKDSYAVIHHIDYDRECITDKYIELSHPTEKRPNKTVKVPDCEKCIIIKECTEFLCPVHIGCNKKIFDKRKEINEMSKEEKKNVVHIMSMLPCNSCNHKNVCRFNDGLKEDSFELPPKEKYPFLKISFDCTEYNTTIDFSEELTENTEPDEIEKIDFDVDDPFN